MQIEFFTDNNECPNFLRKCDFDNGAYVRRVNGVGNFNLTIEK